MKPAAGDAGEACEVLPQGRMLRPALASHLGLPGHELGRASPTSNLAALHRRLIFEDVILFTSFSFFCLFHR
jgi:hypothetical protein